MSSFRKALVSRIPLRSPSTSALRIVDGEGDRCPEVEIEDYNGRWLVQTRVPEFPAWLFDELDASNALGGYPPPRSVYWKRLGDKQSPEHQWGEACTEPFEARENGVRYWIDFSAGYSQGIFLDQRVNRLRVREWCTHRSGARLLNCFSYTCGFGISAALGGAHTTNLDLSRRYLDWGRRNYALNAIRQEDHDFIYGDALDWMQRFKKKGRQFDAVVLDPPTFSRNDKGKVFRVEENLGDLVAAAAALLTEDGLLFVSTNQRSLSNSATQRLVTDALPEARTWGISEGQMPPDFTGERYLKSFFVERSR